MYNFFSKSPSLNLLIEGFPTMPKACLNSLTIFSFDVNEFSVKQLCNIQ